MSVEITINDLREQIVANQEAGRDPSHGIDREVLRDAIRTLRSSRTLDVKKTTSGKKPATKKPAKPAMSQADLDGLLGL